MIIKEKYYRDIISSKIAIGALALMSIFPRIGHAGLYTSPFNPTYNVGPESAWMNPAGMTGVKTKAATAGVQGLIYDAEFDLDVAAAGGGDGGDAGVSSVIPTFFAVVPVSERFRLGLSVFSPLGGPDGFGWDFGDNWAGRYESQEMTFASIAIAPSAAYQVTDKFSIGGGVSAQWLEINQSSAINTFGAGDGKASLNDLEDWAARYFVAGHYQMSPATSFGLIYRSKWELDLEGDLEISDLDVGVPTADFKLDVTLPQEIEIGIQQALSQTWILGLTFGWQDWSQFDQFDVDFAFANGVTSSFIVNSHFTDTYSGGGSLTHIMSGGADIINFGINYASSPVSDSDRVVALPADEALTLSLGYAHNTKTVTYSLGGALVFNGDAEVDENEQGVRFAGDFGTNMIYVLGGSIQLRF